MLDRLLVLSDDDSGGGTASVARHLASHLSTHFSVSFGYNKNIVSDEYYKTLGQLDIGLFNSNCTEGNKYRSAFRHIEAARLLDQTDPSAILFVDAGVVYSHISIKQEAMRRGIPFAVVINGVPPNARKTHPSLLPQAIETLNGARSIIFVSAANKQQFMRLFPDIQTDLSVVPNTCASTFFEPSHPSIREQYRQELGVASNEMLVLITGRVEPHKGQALAIRALAALKGAHGGDIGIKLAFAGSGSESYIQSLIEISSELNVLENVLLLGYRSDIKDILAASDVFCLPSYVEGMPISIVEAMAMGVPVVATAIDGIPEQIDHESGILVSSPLLDEQKCVDELATAFRRLQLSVEARGILAQLGREKATSEFHPSRNIERYLRLITPLSDASDRTAQLSPVAASQSLGQNDTIDFGSPEDAWKFLDKGWGPTRRRGVWSEADASTLTIPLRSTVGHPIISLKLEPHIRGTIDSQPVEFLVDGISLGVVAFGRRLFRRTSWVHLHVDPSPIDREITVTFSYKRAHPTTVRGRSLLIRSLRVAEDSPDNVNIFARIFRTPEIHLGLGRPST